jgi:hypothetical protein
LPGFRCPLSCHCAFFGGDRCARWCRCVADFFAKSSISGFLVQTESRVGRKRKPRRHRMQRLAQAGHILFEVIFVHNARTLSSHGSRSLPRGQYSSDTLREGIDIPRGNPASDYATVNEVFLASHLAGHDHRSARIRHLIDRQSPGPSTDASTNTLHRSWKRGCSDWLRKPRNVAGTRLLGSAIKRRTLLAIANNQQIRHGL